MNTIKPTKLSDVSKREMIKPKPILPNMVKGHWRNYRNGNTVFVPGFFRKNRKNKVSS